MAWRLFLSRHKKSFAAGQKALVESQPAETMEAEPWQDAGL
jgi:hypothetical protein